MYMMDNRIRTRRRTTIYLVIGGTPAVGECRVARCALAGRHFGAHRDGSGCDIARAVCGDHRAGAFLLEEE